MSTDALIPFVDEDPPAGPAPATPVAPIPQRLPWRILIVDDDRDVHESTSYALRGLEIVGRKLQLLHAYSSVEGLDVLRQESDVAVILLDVVMETEHAGLAMVDSIRNGLKLQNTRIILRTGQPGQAPEIETIRQYDINDYKTKSELTRGKLYATLTAAIRSYDQLRRLDASRRGLEKIVAASHHFIAEQGLQTFAEGVITQMASLMGLDPEGLVCASVMPTSPGEAAGDYIVIAAAGPYSHLMQKRITDIDNPDIVAQLTRSLTERRSVVGHNSLTLFFAGRDQQDFAAFVAASQPLREVDHHLLEVFCTNIALCASNVTLFDRLRNVAFVDRLLGLPNRAALIQHLDDLGHDDKLADMVLAKIDVDQFAETNDMFGHRYGDLLLGAIGQRLTEQLSERCFIARVAGNTFAIVGHHQWVNPETLKPLFDEPFVVEEIDRRLSVCMSLVRCDEVPFLNGHELLKDASIAMKRAKAGGQGRIEYFTPALGADSKERTRLLHGLHRAFDHDRLFLVYQPQVSLTTGEVLGVEALLRWRAEDGTMVPPDRFIPVAERSGLIVNLGTWVLRTALYDLGRLHAQGFARLRMAVNVSAVQFSQPDFLDILDEALRDNPRVAPERLELEITESVAMVGMERVAALMREVQSRQVAVAIDDFGTGFSSLSYLDCLPADRLKIDRAFINLLDTERPGARIARMIVPLGHQLGMKVLAEGVETESQANILRELGCDEAQGYRYARPMPLDELLSWLQQQPPRP
ncbi:EAL domain-containing protein [Curvibacter sp. HBC61]|uniref:EAL domain-containing protein n=1 Tax=Curvibacter cyanobacteriorum TaxID=3026422 RepID=A0ABT5MYA6_9BURK|nr:EAL domain-containing protein [Curvibacter sp. HBC61]MDD0838865.1 EAL domain-containing protein [Curvibacter sp. HBC61]